MSRWVGRMLLLSTVAKGLVTCRPAGRLTRQMAFSPVAYFVAEGCSKETASLIVGDAAVAADGDETVWVAATEAGGPTPLGLLAEMGAAQGAGTVLIGMPAAVGRLRLGPEPMLDALRSSIEKEDPRCASALTACVDALVEQWLDSLGGETDTHFESLMVSASLHTATFFESRGFAEIEDPDLTAMGRGTPIATHRARLSATTFAFSTLLERSSAASGLVEERRAARILELLRRQPPPPPEPEDQRPAAPDPWANIQGKWRA
ncbi:hypothetical protein M885DRAFT_506232 [Pelagophyceae sp. CCMP2097]|nr:hypothetical protein M885DRAFT_506232 [Pelagophyceae sp. CCMP2097]